MDMNDANWDFVHAEYHEYWYAIRQTGRHDHWDMYCMGCEL
jgi:hypothetical protein